MRLERNSQGSSRRKKERKREREKVKVSRIVGRTVKVWRR